MSSDLVVDEKFLHGMADLHRLQDAMVTLLISRPKPVEGATGPVVDTKNEYGLMDYVGLKEDGERLLYFKAAADIENKMRISKKLLRKYVQVPFAGTRGLAGILIVESCPPCNPEQELQPDDPHQPRRCPLLHLLQSCPGDVGGEEGEDRQHQGRAHPLPRPMPVPESFHSYERLSLSLAMGFPSSASP
jgi:hypothetical protein